MRRRLQAADWSAVVGSRLGFFVRITMSDDYVADVASDSLSPND